MHRSQSFSYRRVRSMSLGRCPKWSQISFTFNMTSSLAKPNQILPLGNKQFHASRRFHWLSGIHSYSGNKQEVVADLHPKLNYLTARDIILRKPLRARRAATVDVDNTVLQCIMQMKDRSLSCLVLVDDVPADDSQDTRKVCAEGVVSETYLLHKLQHLPYSKLVNLTIGELNKELSWLHFPCRTTITDTLNKMVHHNVWHAVVTLEEDALRFIPMRQQHNQQRRRVRVEQNTCLHAQSVITLGDIAHEIVELQARMPIQSYAAIYNTRIDQFIQNTHSELRNALVSGSSTYQDFLKSGGEGGWRKGKDSAFISRDPIRATMVVDEDTKTVEGILSSRQALYGLLLDDNARRTTKCRDLCKADSWIVPKTQTIGDLLFSAHALNLWGYFLIVDRQDCVSKTTGSITHYEKFSPGLKLKRNEVMAVLGLYDILQHLVDQRHKDIFDGGKKEIPPLSPKYRKRAKWNGGTSLGLVLFGGALLASVASMLPGDTWQSFVGNSSGDSGRFDFFLSYRQGTVGGSTYSLRDKLHKSKHSRLFQREISAFVDERSLPPGLPYDEQFIKAIETCRVFIPFVSNGAFERFRTLDGTAASVDNLLLEWEVALELENAGKLRSIVPLFFGEESPNTEEGYTEFHWQTMDELPDAVHVPTKERARKALRDMGIEPSGDFDARTVREVVAGISKHQGFKLWRYGTRNDSLEACSALLLKRLSTLKPGK